MEEEEGEEENGRGRWLRGRSASLKRASGPVKIPFGDWRVDHLGRPDLGLISYEMSFGDLHVRLSGRRNPAPVG